MYSTRHCCAERPNGLLQECPRWNRCISRQQTPTCCVQVAAGLPLAPMPACPRCCSQHSAVFGLQLRAPADPAGASAASGL